MSNTGEPDIDSEGLLGQKLLGMDLDYEFPTQGQKGCLLGRLSGNRYNKMIREQKLEGILLSCSSLNPQGMRSMPLVLDCTYSRFNLTFFFF